MRQLSRYAFRFLFTLLTGFIAPTAFAFVMPDSVKAMPDCSAVAVYKYKAPKDSVADCKIVVDRGRPGSPLPVQVPPGTKVYVWVDSQQGNEIIQAVVTNDAVAKPDIAGGIIGKLTTPLASLSFTQNYANAKAAQLFAKSDEIDVQKTQDTDYPLLQTVYAGYVEASCLQAYVTYDSSKVVCTTTPIVSVDAFETQRQNAIRDIKKAIDTKLPSSDDIAALDDAAKKFCSGKPDKDGSDCFKIKSNQLAIDAISGLIAAKGKSTSLNGYLAALIMWQRVGDTILPIYTQPKDRKLTIKVNGVEQIGNTTFSIASIAITWQQSNWSLSTGVVLSALKNKTYANAPLYNTDGTPNTDGTGKVYTQVTVAKTYPGIISPVFLVNYRLRNFQANSGRMAILFSGGLGANIVSKSADFAAGPSFQWGSVIFSPVVHYGRQTQLTSGVHVGDQLGTSPPTLPTVAPYKPAVGIGITYRLPLP